MLVLPSVGASVSRIILNESATKAKIFFDDGSTTIVSTNNTPNKKVVKSVSKTPNGISIKKKSVVRTESKGMPSMFKQVKTSQGTLNVQTSATEKNQQIFEAKKMDVIERAKKRAALLEAETMDASAKMALTAEEGSEVEI